jgi:hypothetical protein
VGVDPGGDAKDNARDVKSDGEHHSLTRREVDSFEEIGRTRVNWSAVGWRQSAAMRAFHFSASRGSDLGTRQSTIMLTKNTGSRVMW